MRATDRPAAAPSDAEIEVLEPNRWAVWVFDRCEWIMHIGMMKKPYYQGISAQEIRAAAVLLRVPRDVWPEVTRGILDFMVPAAMKIYNG